MASYKQAIEWIVDEDDIEFLNDEEPIISVTGSMVANLWNKDVAVVMKDIQKEANKRK